MGSFVQYKDIEIYLNLKLLVTYLAGKSPFAISGNANAPIDNTDVRLDEK